MRELPGALKLTLLKGEKTIIKGKEIIISQKFDYVPIVIKGYLASEITEDQALFIGNFNPNRYEEKPLFCAKKELIKQIVKQLKENKLELVEKSYQQIWETDDQHRLDTYPKNGKPLNQIIVQI